MCVEMGDTWRKGGQTGSCCHSVPGGGWRLGLAQSIRGERARFRPRFTVRTQSLRGTACREKEDGNSRDVCLSKQDGLAVP